MSEKKELNQEQLDIAVGGDGKDGRDGGAIYNTSVKNSNAIYGVDNQKPISGSGVGGGELCKAGPQIMTDNCDPENTQTKDDYVNPWK